MNVERLIEVEAKAGIERDKYKLMSPRSATASPNFIPWFSSLVVMDSPARSPKVIQ